MSSTSSSDALGVGSEGLTSAEHFEASTRYLALADRAARTVARLIERLDQHRGRGQQQITVKHVTVNAGQAVVTDQIVSDKGKQAVATNLLTARNGQPDGDH
jgi:predicted metal-dependent hydrolase